MGPVALPLTEYTDSNDESHEGQPDHKFVIAVLPDQSGRVARAAYRMGKTTKFMELVARDASSVEIYFIDTKTRARIPCKAMLKIHEENGEIVAVDMFTVEKTKPFAYYFGHLGADEVGASKARTARASFVDFPTYFSPPVTASTSLLEI